MPEDYTFGKTAVTSRRINIFPSFQKRLEGLGLEFDF